MLIEMIKQDIDGACQKSASTCPVANAIRRTLGLPSMYVGVYPAWVYLGSPLCVKHCLPPIAMQFVQDFDDNNDVRLISFELPLEWMPSAQPNGVENCDDERRLQ